MFKDAVSKYIWLATCQCKIYENKSPLHLQHTRLFNSAFVTLPRVPYVQSRHVRGVFWGKIYSTFVTLPRVPYVQSGHVKGVLWGKI